MFITILSNISVTFKFGYTYFQGASYFETSFIFFQNLIKSGQKDWDHKVRWGSIPFHFFKVANSNTFKTFEICRIIWRFGIFLFPRHKTLISHQVSITRFTTLRNIFKWNDFMSWIIFLQQNSHHGIKEY